MVSNGKSAFIKKWGNRPLEDDWRRSNKEKDLSTEVGKVLDKAPLPILDIDESNTDSKSLRTKLLAQFYQEIPRSKKDIDSSNNRLQRALFRLAQIYDFSLEEYKNAYRSYSWYIDSFYVEERVPEAMYANYIICKIKIKDSLCADHWNKRLQSEFPKSLYAKLILNPNYLVENQLLGERLKAQYRKSFELYENGNFLAAQNQILASMTENPENEYTERFVLLRAMIVGRTQSVSAYIDSLKHFINTYNKTSNLVPYAKDLLAKAQNLMKSDSVNLSKNKVVYDLDLNYTHLYVIVITDPADQQSLLEKYKLYNSDFYSDQELKTMLIPWVDGAKLLVVEPFNSNILSMNYYNRQKGISSPLKPYEDKNYMHFVISRRNFDIMLAAQNHNTYIPFFKKIYLKE
jgi:hypothetical protein